jgi:hypothetical protein
MFMSDEHLRVQQQIRLIYEIQKEQWLECSNNMNQYKKELNAQHAVMKERLTQHEDSLKQTLKEMRAHVSDSRSALDAILRSRT